MDARKARSALDTASQQPSNRSADGERLPRPAPRCTALRRAAPRRAPGRAGAVRTGRGGGASTGAHGHGLSWLGHQGRTRRRGGTTMLRSGAPHAHVLSAHPGGVRSTARALGPRPPPLQGRFNGQKEGYLAKRGRRLGVWKPRYYRFQGGALHYYRQSGAVRGHRVRAQPKRRPRALTGCAPPATGPNGEAAWCCRRPRSRGAHSTWTMPSWRRCPTTRPTASSTPRSQVSHAPRPPPTLR